MRLSYFLLVATATTLLVSGNVVTASDRTTGDSIMTSPDLVISLGAVQGVGGDKRFLRKHKDEFGEPEGVGDDEGEERQGNNLFSSAKMDKVLKDSAFRSKRFFKWKRLGWTPGLVQGRVPNDVFKKYKYWRYHGPGQ